VAITNTQGCLGLSGEKGASPLAHEDLGYEKERESPRSSKEPSSF